MEALRMVLVGVCGVLLVIGNMPSCTGTQTEGTEFVGYLGGGMARNEGWLQVYVDNVWVSVCNRNWTKEQAETTCRLLGFDGVQSDGWDVYLGAGSGPVRCPEPGSQGDDSLELTTCSDVSGDVCTHNDDVGLKCVWQPSEEDFMNRLGYMFRLTGPEAGGGEGRLEVFVDEAWGTVCARGWTATFADAVCKHLGYRGVTATGWLLGPESTGSGPVACADVFSLGVCPSGGEELGGGMAPCTHDDDVAIRCAAEDDGMGNDGNANGRDMEMVRMVVVAASSVLVAMGLLLPILACYLLLSARSTMSASEDLENLIGPKEAGEEVEEEREGREEEGEGCKGGQKDRGLPATLGEVNEGYNEAGEDLEPEGKGNPCDKDAEADGDTTADGSGNDEETDRDAMDGDAVKSDQEPGQGASSDAVVARVNAADCQEASNDDGAIAENEERPEVASTADDVTDVKVVEEEEDQTTTQACDGMGEDVKRLEEAEAVPVGLPEEINENEDDSGETVPDYETLEPTAEKFEFSRHGPYSLNCMYF